MSNPPEITLEPRTDTQKLEDAIVKACATIRDNWPHMIQAGETQAPGRVNPSGVMLDDHDQRETDTRRIDRVISHRRYAQDVLAAVCELIRDDRPVTNPASFPYRTDVPGMAAFINTHAEWLSWQGPDTMVADDLGKVARKVQLIVTPPVKDWIALGSCPLEVEFNPEVGPVVCGGQVRATQEARGMEQPTCKRCGTEAAVEWWYSQMFSGVDVSHLVTADELIGVIAVRLDWVVSHGQVRQWKHRGKIESAGKDAKGRTLYRHADVVEAIRADVQLQREKVN